MRLLLFAFLLVSVAGCFHKDVMSDRADNVEHTFIYSGTEGNFVITKEEVFQATNKESGGGVTHISGYAEYRLTAYDAATGSRVARVELGEGQQEGACIVLGSTPGKIWLMSLNPDWGLHCRHPKTLEIIQKQGDLQQLPAFSKFQFATCEWYKMNQFYGMDATGTRLLISDMNGYRYAWQPGAAQLQRTEEKIVNTTLYSISHLLTTSSSLRENESVSLSGSPRQHFSQPNAWAKSNLSFLNGQLLQQLSVPVLNATRGAEIMALQLRYDSIAQRLNQQQLATTPNDRRAVWALRELERDTQQLGTEIRRKQQATLSVSDLQLLTPGDQRFFVMHATDVSDTAHTQLTCLPYGGAEVRELWTVRLNRYYADPSKAEAQGAFDIVFSEGNPQFDYRWADCHAEKLYLIAQLQLCCVDVKTGRLLWDIDL